MNGNHVPPRTRLLLHAGVAVPVVFWAALALCALQLGDYSHWSNLVSELGAAGTETRVLFATGLLLCALLSVAFAVGLIIECRRRRITPIPALVIFLYSFSIAGAAIFPMPHRLHGLLGSPAILVLLSPVLAAVLWRKGVKLRSLAPVAIISFVVMALGFLVFVPSVLAEYVGFKQRLFHAGWSIWFGYLSLGFSGVFDRVREKPLGAGFVPGRSGSRQHVGRAAGPAPSRSWQGRVRASPRLTDELPTLAVRRW